MTHQLRSRVLYCLALSGLAAAALAARAAGDEEQPNPLARGWEQFRQTFTQNLGASHRQGLDHNAGHKFVPSRPVTRAPAAK